MCGMFMIDGHHVIGDAGMGRTQLILGIGSISLILHEVVIYSCGVRSAHSLDVKTSSHPPWHNGKLLCRRRTRRLALNRQNCEKCARPEGLPCPPCCEMSLFLRL